MHLLTLNDDVLLQIVDLLETQDHSRLLRTSRNLHTLVSPHFPRTVILRESPEHTTNFLAYLLTNLKRRAPPIRRLVLERPGFVQDPTESDSEIEFPEF